MPMLNKRKSGNATLLQRVPVQDYVAQNVLIWVVTKDEAKLDKIKQNKNK